MPIVQINAAARQALIDKGATEQIRSGPNGTYNILLDPAVAARLESLQIGQAGIQTVSDAILWLCANGMPLDQ